MYKVLVKLFLKENLSLKRLMGFDIKKSKKKAVLMTIAIVYALVVFVGGMGLMFFDLGKILNEMGLEDILISFFAIYAIIIALFITLFRASGSLFYYKDYQILAPLPIKSQTVLWAKMTVMMIMLYLSSFVFTLPIVFSYFYWNGFNLLSLIYLIIGFFFISLVPVVIVSLISLLIAKLTASLRHNKLLSIFLMFGLMIGIFLVLFSVNDVEQNPLTGQIDLFKGVASAYLPFDWYRRAVHETSLLHLVYVVLSNVFIFALFMFSIHGVVQKTNQKGIRIRTRKNGTPIKYQQRSVLFALVQKEVKKFFSVTLYAVNSGFGPIILLVASVASLFYQKELAVILADAIGADLKLEIMIIGLIGFSLAMTYTPAISLSLEGKNFWIIKSLPIKPKTIMYSKILFNMLLTIPIGLLSVLLFGISLKLSLTSQITMMLLVIIFSTTISTIDAFINLLVPKFDFMNEVEIIKQSAGALLGLLAGFTLMAINGFTFYFLYDMLDISLIFLLMSLVNVILLVPLIYLFETKTEKFFIQFKA